MLLFFFFSSRRRHTRCSRDWSSDVCSSDLSLDGPAELLDPIYLEVARKIRVKGHLAEEIQAAFAPLRGRPVVGVHIRHGRSEERRVGKECRSRWSPYH